ncbi:MAG: DUF1631 family protein, partial [Gammaproteobacteria bacterium]
MSSTSLSSAGGTGAERRRYVRQPITLEAMISIQGRKPLPCVVRDFCVAGIFVSLGAEHLHDLTKHTKATLRFTLNVGGAMQPLQLGLVIFRVVGNGIGCGFFEPDRDAIALLKKFADAASANVPDSEESFAETQSKFRPDYLRIKDDLIDLCVKRTNGLIEDFVNVADEALFLSARDAANNQEETRFLDGQNEFRERKSAIEKGVPAFVKKALQIINSPISATSEADEQRAEVGELSLIEKEEFEEFLTVSELVSELEPKFKAQLYDLEKRFQFLARREVDEHSNPLGPEVICNIFAECLKNLQSDRSAINQIYSSLKKVLDAGLGHFYDEVNAFLIGKNVLPIIKKEKPNFKRRPSAPTPEAPVTQAPTDDLSASGNYSQQDLASTFGRGTYPQGAAPQSGQTAAPPPAPLQPGLTPPEISGQSQGNPVAPSAQGGSQPVVAPGAQQPAGGGGPGQAGPEHTPASGETGAAGVGGSPVQGGRQVIPGQVPDQPPGAPAVGGTQAGVPAGSGQAVPGFAPRGHGVQGGTATSGAEAGGGAMGAFDTTFGGSVGGPAVYTTPSLQQAYSTAQTQLAVRRNLNEYLAGGAVAQPVGNAYPTNQVLDGLTRVQHSLAGETNPETLEVAKIKDRITQSIRESGGVEGHIGQEEADAIEVMANLFKSLINDSYLNTGARNNLARLQAPVHKVALMDNDFFETTDHPVRQVLNRVALVEDTVDEQGIGQNERLAALIDQVNREFTDDVAIFNPVVGELDEILLEQRRRYQENVDSVVQSSIEQQQILHERRSKDFSATDTSPNKKELPAEWNKWLDRVRAFQVGDRFIMNANTDNPFPISLVWIGEDGEPFVLVDQKGHKVSTLTMQQVAMYLRRGTLKLLDPNAAAAVDRALFGMVNQMHGEVEEQVTRDELTKFLARNTFVQEIDKNLAAKLKKGQGAALCQLSIDSLKAINERAGVEAGDTLLQQVAATLTENIGAKKVFFGRLSGSELAIFWQRGGVAAAQKQLETCLEKFAQIDLTADDDQFTLEASIGLMAVEDDLTLAKDLLSVVGDACETARNNPAKSIYIAGSENKYKEKLEQMVNYVAKAYDRERLVFLIQRVRSLNDAAQIPAAHVVVSAEDRNGRIIPPSLFEQAIEKSDRAFDVDQWVIKNSLAWMRNDEKVLDAYSAVIIPLSKAAVDRDDLADIVVSELMETAVP